MASLAETLRPSLVSLADPNRSSTLFACCLPQSYGRIGLSQSCTHTMAEACEELAARLEGCVDWFHRYLQA